MDNNDSFLDIQPRRLYPLIDVATKLGYSSRTKRAELAKKLKAQGQGENKVVLGENLLIYMGSPTIARMKPEGHLEDMASK